MSSVQEHDSPEYHIIVQSVLEAEQFLPFSEWSHWIFSCNFYICVKRVDKNLSFKLKKK
jgi:hypothetical protein